VNDPGVGGMDRPLPRTRYRSWLLVAGAILLVVIVVVSTTTLSRSERSVRLLASGVMVARTKRGLFQDFVPLRARVVPRDIVFLDAQEGGRVETILVQAGDTVEVGQELIAFGNTDLQLQVIEREARLIEQINNLRSAEAGLEETKAANEKALEEINYNIIRLERLGNRVSTLASRGATSVEDKENLLDDLEHYERLRPIVAESNRKQDALRTNRLPEIHEELEKLHQNLQIVRGKLDNLIVRAPVAGRITQIDLTVGQNCERGGRLAEITPITGFKLSAEVDEFYLGRVRERQQADVALGTERATVEVSRVYPQVKEGRFKIDLAFTGQEPAGLLAGQSVQGRLRLGDDRTATILPSGAFLEQTGGDWIFVVAGDGRSAQRRPIQVGRRNAEQIEILRGLQPGDRAIISEYRGLERIDHVELVD
jgi:HlyD family secretion protein